MEKAIFEVGFQDKPTNLTWLEFEIFRHSRRGLTSSNAVAVNGLLDFWPFAIAEKNGAEHCDDSIASCNLQELKGWI